MKVVSKVDEGMVLPVELAGGEAASIVPNKECGALVGIEDATADGDGGGRCDMLSAAGEGTVRLAGEVGVAAGYGCPYELSDATESTSPSTPALMLSTASTLGFAGSIGAILAVSLAGGRFAVGMEAGASSECPGRSGSGEGDLGISTERIAVGADVEVNKNLRAESIVAGDGLLSRRTLGACCDTAGIAGGDKASFLADSEPGGPR